VISEVKSTLSNFVTANSDLLFPAKPNLSIPASPNPLLPAKPVEPLQAKQVLHLPGKSDPPLPACSQRLQFHPYLPSWTHCYQRSEFHPYQWSKIQPYLVAPIEARPSTSWLLPLSPNQLLQAKSVLPVPVSPDPPLSDWSQRGQIVREVRVGMSEWWDQACQSSETKHVRALKISMSELYEQAYQLWKWTCQSYRGEAKSKASCLLIANPDSLLPAKPHPPVQVCFQ